MKKIKALLLIILGLFYFSNIAYAEWQVDVSEWQNWAHNNVSTEFSTNGPSLWGHFATRHDCEAAREQAYDNNLYKGLYKESQCVPKQGSGGATTFIGGSGNIDTNAGAKQFLMNSMINMLGNALSNALSPQSQQVNTQAQQKLLWQEKQAAIKKEKERQAALAIWKKEKDKAMRQKIDEQYITREEGKKVLAKLDKVSSPGSLNMKPISSGTLKAFNSGNLNLASNDLQPIGTGRYDTSGLSPLKRASCAKYFSQAALTAANNGDDAKAKHLNQQAQKVISGQMIDRECQFPVLANIPEVPRPVKAHPVSNQKTVAYYEGLIKTVQQDTRKLKDIRIKLKKADKKIKQAKEKKQKAEQKIAEIKKSAALTKKPREKQKANDLLSSAQALLQESENEIQTATDAKQNLSKKKEQIVTKLKDIQKRIQSKTGTN